MEPALEHVFETGQGAVRYGIKGHGPDLVLVHGTPWSSFSFSKILPALEKRFRVHYYDLIGYGRSEMRDRQKVSLDIQGQIFSELLEHWELADPFVAAHDFGGAISLRAHLLHGRNYRKLLLMNVVALAPWGSPFFAHVREHETAFSGTPPYIHKAILEAYIKGALHKEPKIDDLSGLMTPWETSSGQAAFYRQIAQADQKYTDEVEVQYSDIRCPVRILWGEADEWIPIATGRRLHAAIPNSEFFPISEAGHLVQMEAPEQVHAQILDFFD